MNSFRHIRWLHLSDFHTGKDGYGERMLFKSILAHVAKNAPPDFIFISGDIAQAGLKAQYEKFGEEFLLPLKEKTGDDCTILLVPGNHDVDRSKQEFVTREVVRQKSIQFFDPDENGLSKRQAILPRFAAYRESYIPLVDNKGDWLASRGGCFIHISTSKGVGILGLNTAWFAENEHDERELTPGKLILETGLEQIKNSEIKIVLGHHPLDWFQREEAEAIRALFGHHQVIYLHGHMHKNRSRFEEGAGYPFLTLQSGAAFQAREDEQWINGLLWAELDRTKQRLALKPLLWNKNNQEWALDGAAFPERCRLPDTDRWILPLPGSQAAPLSDPPKSKPTADKPAKFFKPPPGWEIVNQEYLDKIDKNPDEAVILSYFDGRIPNWGLALCPDIPRRTAVKEITDRLVVAPEEKRPSINMLLGAGGEGKSTAFLQIIEAVLQSGKSWQVLHRRGDNTPLDKKMIDELPKDGRHWLIASDDADLIAEDVYRIARDLQSNGCGDVHFLLSARHTDWRNTKVSPPQWEHLPGYHERELRGLDDEDAARIVDAWSVYHEQGLGRLAGLSKQDAVKKLVAETRSEKSREDGAFLGALLRLRFGEQLKAHVKKLLDRLQERKILPGENSNTLLHAFAYIAAMHAENKLFLSKLVLAKALGIEQGKLRSKVLWPLGEEAAADVAGEMVFTRHRAIAETALDILANTLYYDVELDDIYVDLVSTAEELSQTGHFIIALEKWRYLSDHFFNKSNPALAIRLAQALVQAAKTDSFFRVKLAQLFRKAGQPEQALRVFRDAPQPDNNRSFFHEWATAEGNEGNRALNVWLDAVSLADETAKKPPDNKTAALCFAGFGLACRELFEAYNKPVFIQGCGAAAQLGLSLACPNRLKSIGRFLDHSIELICP